MSFSIAIDGPAGAGKSSVARKVAQKTGAIYVDTGAMYRALAVHFIQSGLKPEEEEGIIDACAGADVTIDYADGEQQVYLNGVNVTDKLRTEDVSAMASVSSSIPQVRAKLKDLQQGLARVQDVVMDGRDIGTVILPDAQLKIFLTASPLARAQRRYLQLKEAGVECDLEELTKEMEERDYRDSHRSEAPLRQADDAVLVDSSDMTIEEVINRIADLAEERRKA